MRTGCMAAPGFGSMCSVVGHLRPAAPLGDMLAADIFRLLHKLFMQPAWSPWTRPSL